MYKGALELSAGRFCPGSFCPFFLLLLFRLLLLPCHLPSPLADHPPEPGSGPTLRQLQHLELHASQLLSNRDGSAGVQGGLAGEDGGRAAGKSHENDKLVLRSTAQHAGQAYWAQHAMHAGSTARAVVGLGSVEPVPFWQPQVIRMLWPHRPVCLGDTALLGLTCSHSSVQAPLARASISSSAARAPMLSAGTPRSPRPAGAAEQGPHPAVPAVQNAERHAWDTACAQVPGPCRLARVCQESKWLSNTLPPCPHARPPCPCVPPAHAPELPSRHPPLVSATSNTAQPSPKARSAGSNTASTSMGTRRLMPQAPSRDLTSARG